MAHETVVTLGATPEQDLYLALGRAIAGQCPAGFEEAQLEAELGDAGTTMRLAWTAGDGTEGEPGLGPEAEVRIRELLHEIREKMIREKQGSWRRCRVTLRKGGRFAMDVYQ